MRRFISLVRVSHCWRKAASFFCRRCRLIPVVMNADAPWSMIVADISLRGLGKNLLNNSHKVTVSISMSRDCGPPGSPRADTYGIVRKKGNAPRPCSNINGLIWIFDGGTSGRYGRFGSKTSPLIITIPSTISPRAVIYSGRIHLNPANRNG